MRIALEKLGYYDVYHFSSVFEHEAHFGLWIAALIAKYENDGNTSEETFSRDYWDNMLGRYNVCPILDSYICGYSNNVVVYRQ